MDAALAAMLTDTVQVVALTGRDVYGAATYGVPVPRPARIQRRFITQFGATGRQVVEETTLFFAGDIVMQGTERLILPDGSHAPIQGFAPKPDETGAIHHYEVKL